MPGDIGTADRVNAGALLAGAVVALAPEVVVDDVAAGGDGAPLVAEVGATGQGLGGEGSGIAGGGQRQGKKRKGSEGLHGEDVEMRVVDHPNPGGQLVLYVLLLRRSSI